MKNHPEAAKNPTLCFGNLFLKYLEISKYLWAPPTVAPKTLDIIMCYSSGAKTKLKKRKQQVKTFVHYNHLRRSK